MKGKIQRKKERRKSEDGTELEKEGKWRKNKRETWETRRGVEDKEEK